MPKLYVDAGHVMLNRIDSKSQLKVLTTCRELLAQGCSVLFFPEGTRSKDGRLHEFKKVILVLLCLSSISFRCTTVAIMSVLLSSIFVIDKHTTRICGSFKLSTN
jgi:Acyltransferase